MGFSDTSQAGRLKHRLLGDDLSNMRDSVGFMIFIETIIQVQLKYIPAQLAKHTLI